MLEALALKQRDARDILPLECKVRQEQTITDQTKIHMLL